METAELLFLQVEHLDSRDLLLSLLRQILFVLCSDFHDFLHLSGIMLNSTIQIVLFSLKYIHFSGFNLVDHDGRDSRAVRVEPVHLNFALV